MVQAGDGSVDRKGLGISGPDENIKNEPSGGIGSNLRQFPAIAPKMTSKEGSLYRSADGIEHFDHDNRKAIISSAMGGINVLRGQLLRAAVIRRVEDRRSNPSSDAPNSRAMYAEQCVADVLQTCKNIDESESGIISSSDFADAMTVHRLTDGMSASEVQSVVQSVELPSNPGMVNYQTTLPELLKAVESNNTRGAVNEQGKGHSHVIPSQVHQNYC